MPARPSCSSRTRVCHGPGRAAIPTKSAHNSRVPDLGDSYKPSNFLLPRGVESRWGSSLAWSSHDLEAELKGPVCRQVISGPRNHTRHPRTERSRDSPKPTVAGPGGEQLKFGQRNLSCNHHVVIGNPARRARDLESPRPPVIRAPRPSGLPIGAPAGFRLDSPLSTAGPSPAARGPPRTTHRRR